MKSLTADERALLKEYGVWLSDSVRVDRFRQVLEVARSKKLTPPAISSPEADEAAAKAARQYWCSLFDQFEASRG